MNEKVLEHLTQSACPSIAMRVREEILGEVLSLKDRASYFSKIEQSTAAARVLGWQNEDGYFGERFHTPPSKSKVWSHEGSVRYLLEMGFDNNFLPLKKSLDVLLLKGWERECVGKAAEVFGAGNIRASLFAQAGLESADFMVRWIETALQGFRFIYKAGSISDIVVPYRDKQIFAAGKYLPNIYHLRILAFTHSWRTGENIAMVSEALKKLYFWLPIKPAYIKHRSQLIAPACNIAHEYNSDLMNIDGSYAFLWLHFYEMIARMGMLGLGSPFRPHFGNLLSRLDKTEGFFIERYDKKAFLYWSGYSGLALEDDWGKESRRINDMTFRVYLIEALMNRNYLPIQAA
jgi:hypothetical protein